MTEFSAENVPLCEHGNPVDICTVCVGEVLAQRAEQARRRGWWVEPQGPSQAFLVNPNGGRVALMSRARANGIAAALNTPEGDEAFNAGRLARTHERDQFGRTEAPR